MSDNWHTSRYCLKLSLWELHQGTAGWLSWAGVFVESTPGDLEIVNVTHQELSSVLALLE